MIKKLRDGNKIRLYDSHERLFIQFQLNKNENNICWERWVSADQRNWVNHNLFLSLKEVDAIHSNIMRKKIW